MAKAKDERDMVRLSVDVSPEFYDLLDELARQTRSTKSDVMRKAIALMEVAVEARMGGEKLFVSKQAPDGASREIVGIGM